MSLPYEISEKAPTLLFWVSTLPLVTRSLYLGQEEKKPSSSGCAVGVEDGNILWPQETTGTGE
jgi:hypothetical protein